MRLESLRQGAFALAAYPLRSALGALAIAVAVATIVTVVTALDGVRLYTEMTTARTFGSDTFVIAQVAGSSRVSRRELQEQLARNPPIRRSDHAFLERHADDLVLYAPSAQTRAEVSSGSRLLEDATVTGTTAALAEIRDLDLARGRFFRPAEDVAGDAVAVIGADVADTLFPTSDPLQQTLRLGGRRFTVIGVQARLGSAGSGSLDKYVWIPLRAYERAFGAPRTLQVFAKAPPGHDAVSAEGRARVSMRARRALGPGQADSFDVLTPDAARSFVANLSQRIGAAAGPISLMALLAAIVVVTNTVLVSVTQRTREIGVRRALGARAGDIVREIVAESLLLSVAGGLAGALAAWLLLATLEYALELPLTVAPQTLTIAITAAAGSGILAAWYPATRAVALDVVAAIRME
ncbi:MAG: ABC transporter permease [Acidobacteriota bacterium]|nr:ABC transporter permease [Acidobacteriota bacterium]